MIASQHQSASAQTNAIATPQWRSRSELHNANYGDDQYQRVADRSFENSSSVTHASLGRPTSVGETQFSETRLNVPANVPATSSKSMNSMPSAVSSSRYRDVPNSPWERSPQSLEPNRPNTSFDSYQAGVYQSGSRANQTASATANIIRQPAASVDRVYSQESLQPGILYSTPAVQPGSKGLPDRRDFQQPSDPSTRGMEMTMELSGYEKPTTKGFINQPRQAVTSSDRTAAQRLPYGGVAISNELESTSVGLGYPESVNSNDATDFDTPTIRIQQPVLSPKSTNVLPSSIPSSVPREAVRDLPVTEEALRKAAQINERSQNRDSIRARYAQQRPLDQARSNTDSRNGNGLGAFSSQPYESASTTRSNVVGIIGGMEPQARSKPLVHSEDADYPFSTSSIQVVPASVGIRQSSTDELGQSRMRTASRVSAELLDASRGPLAKSPLPIEPPTGWKTIEDSLKQHLAKCDDLLRRGAILSAREEVLMGMRSLFRTIDLRGGTWMSEPAMDQALAAFAEESDFYRSNSTPGTGQNTERIISGHKTNALKQTQLHLVSPDLAAQHYRAYAKQQWLVAAQGHPWTADLLYAYGKTLEREADQNPNESQMRRSQAVVCYQAAMEVNPRNADNANQLGFALLQLDRVDEAHVALNHSIRVNPKAETWNNLAEVYRRRGEADQVAYAQRNVQSLKQTVAPEMVGVPEVIEVDAKTFASVSPYPTGMQPSIPAQSQVQQASAVAPPAKSSWFGKLFK